MFIRVKYIQHIFYFLFKLIMITFDGRCRHILDKLGHVDVSWYYDDDVDCKCIIIWAAGNFNDDVLIINLRI